MGKDICKQIMFLKVPSNLTLNASSDWLSHHSLGNLFQCLTTLILRNFFLLSDLQPPYFSLKLLLLVLSLQALTKSLSPTFLQVP